MAVNIFKFQFLNHKVNYSMVFMVAVYEYITSELMSQDQTRNFPQLIFRYVSGECVIFHPELKRGPDIARLFSKVYCYQREIT